MRIYIGNLPYTTTDPELRVLFENYGPVSDSNIPMDRDTGRSKGFGFVEMPNKAEAVAAITAVNGMDYQGRILSVSEARPRDPNKAKANSYKR